MSENYHSQFKNENLIQFKTILKLGGNRDHGKTYFINK